MLTLERTAKYAEDEDRLIDAGFDLAPLDYVISVLLKGKRLNAIYNDHALRTRFTGYRECHIEDDWLLIYKVDQKVLRLVATGNHTHLFNR